MWIVLVELRFSIGVCPCSQGTTLSVCLITKSYTYLNLVAEKYLYHSRNIACVGFYGVSYRIQFRRVLPTTLVSFLCKYLYTKGITVGTTPEGLYF